MAFSVLPSLKAAGKPGPSGQQSRPSEPVAVGTAGWLNLIRPGSMVEITELPLTLIPLWAVPVLLSSHIQLVRQQVRRAEIAAATSVSA